VSELPFYLAAFVVALGVLVVVHEFGHYLAARLCGVKVLRFSLGFGRILWRRQLGSDGTEWALSVFPLGGYVKMLDEREGEVAADEAHRAFNRQGVGRRSLIVVAGPLANFLLAIALYWGLFIHGGLELRPVLGTPPEGSPAAVAAIANGERVRRVDESPVATWDEFRWTLLHKALAQPEAELEVINRQGEIAFRRIALAAAGEQGWEGDALGRLGIRLYRPDVVPVFGRLVDGGAADRAGLRSGDRVRQVDGEAVASWFELVRRIRESPGRPLALTVEREGGLSTVAVVPEAVRERGREIGRIGAAVADQPGLDEELRVFVRYGPFDALAKALTETWDKSVFSLQMMGRMLTGEVSLKNLSGPVSIADYAGQSARLGIDYYIRFMALLSLSLGVLNLLPVPVLDGGHLMYHMIEVVRRRPLSERAMQIGQQIGLSILLALMAFAFFNDLNRLFNG
jgi:regulator of sigma E protease